MPTQVRCHCRGKSECELCHGARFYEYQPGPRGWMPFTCPTCKGRGVVPGVDEDQEPCFTCQRVGRVDPADPPFDDGWRGQLRIAWKFLFGGG